MKYVLDTNVISEILKLEPDFNTLCWIQDHSDDVLITSVTVEEMYYGLFLMPDGKRKDVLRKSLDAVMKDCADRVLAFDAFCACLCGQLRAKSRAEGRTATLEDQMIAAICQRHDMPVVTRNVKDFAFLDVEVVNPFEYESETLKRLRAQQA